MPKVLIVRDMGRSTPETIIPQMEAFNEKRNPLTRDEIWLIEPAHSFFSKGLASPIRNRFSARDIPVVDMVRGGDVTFHAPGQLIACVLFDLKALGLDTRTFVELIEDATIRLITKYESKAHRITGKPGVYVNDQKIASLGFRVKEELTSFGVAINVDMDLTPFQAIKPCGYHDLEMTQLVNLTSHAVDVATLKQSLAECVIAEFKKKGVEYTIEHT